MSCPVAEVAYENEKSTIICQNGGWLTADQVIIAVPNGVLKSNTIKFKPSLPSWKQEAINSFGLGNVCKIVISFTSGKNYNFPKTDFLGVVVSNV